MPNRQRVNKLSWDIPGGRKRQSSQEDKDRTPSYKSHDTNKTSSAKCMWRLEGKQLITSQKHRWVQTAMLLSLAISQYELGNEFQHLHVFQIMFLFYSDCRFKNKHFPVMIYFLFFLFSWDSSMLYLQLRLNKTSLWFLNVNANNWDIEWT